MSQITQMTGSQKASQMIDRMVYLSAKQTLKSSKDGRLDETVNMENALMQQPSHMHEHAYVMHMTFLDVSDNIHNCIRCVFIFHSTHNDILTRLLDILRIEPTDCGNCSISTFNPSLRSLFSSSMLFNSAAESSNFCIL